MNWIVVPCYVLFLKVIFSVWIMRGAWKLSSWIWKHPTRKLYLYMTKNGTKGHFSLWKDSFLGITPYDQWTTCYFSIYVLASLLMFITSLICCWVNWIIGPCPAVNAHRETEACLVDSPQWHFWEICILWIVTCRSLS